MGSLKLGSRYFWVKVRKGGDVAGVEVGWEVLVLTFFLGDRFGVAGYWLLSRSRAGRERETEVRYGLLVWCNEALKCQPCPVTYLLRSVRVRVVEKEMATQKERRQGGRGGLWAASISARKKAVSGMLPPSHHAAQAVGAFGGVQACRTAHQPASLNSRRPTSSTTDPAVPGSKVQGATVIITGESAHLFLTFNTRLSNVEFGDEKCRGAGSQSSRGKRRGELLLTEQMERPSLEILRLLGLSRLGAGAVGKNAQQKKKVPQRCFRYGPGAGFHLNMPCQQVSDSCPPKMPPPKNATSHCCPAPSQFRQPASCCRSRPLLPK